MAVAASSSGSDSDLGNDDYENTVTKLVVQRLLHRFPHEDAKFIKNRFHQLFGVENVPVTRAEEIIVAQITHKQMEEGGLATKGKDIGTGLRVKKKSYGQMGQGNGPVEGAAKMETELASNKPNPPNSGSEESVPVPAGGASKPTTDEVHSHEEDKDKSDSDNDTNHE